MNQLSASLLIASLVATAGCYTVNFHLIADVPANRLPISARLDIPPETAKFTYDVRSAAAGAANRFRILVGEALSQYAKAYLRPVFPEGDDVSIGIKIEGFDVRDFEAHIDVQFSVVRNGQGVFKRKYHANGTGYFAQTAWGGVFAMKSSMRKSTDEALRSLFEQFLEDVNSEYSGWVIEDLEVPIEDTVEPGPAAQRIGDKRR